tara:strand:+ start:547 stop:1836 length:1290 start_codon:yes stop_codon:yes gene_type:complete
MSAGKKPPPANRSRSEIMADAITRLSLASDLEEVSEIIPRAARKLIGSDGATFVLKETGQCSYVGEEVIGPKWQGKHFPDSSDPGWWPRQKKQLKISDVDADERIPHEAYKETLIRSLVMVPIRRENPIGSIGVCWAEEHIATDEEMRILQSLADATAVMVEDLTLRHTMEHLVAERTAALQAVNAELETFASTVSHDLKNPLSVVTTNVWTLREMFGAELSESALKCVGRIEQAGNRMREQIDGMLALYRVSKADIEPESINLSLMGREILDELSENEPGRNVKTQVVENLIAFGDQRMLRVVLENLLGNAWKYTSKRKKGARITLDVMQTEQDGDVFFVRDNGAGFDMARAGKLFGVFQRLHQDSDFAGTGVGLASVQRIINKHGGRIWAEAEEGKGATFYFTLPTVPVLVKLEKTLQEMEVAREAD